ncbi:MAG: SH3 domain-containing protein [Pseudomonadota bacterium]
MRRGFGCGLAMVFGAMVALCAGETAKAAEALTRGASGYPVPRFVSLAKAKVNVRVGPSTGHKIKWTFKKAGLPVEIVREYGNWRRVRYADGAKGWVHHSLLSGRRMALVMPWSDGETVALRASANDGSKTTALLEPLVLASVEACDGAWCSVSGHGWRGHVPQGTLWGVYPTERFD